jgi:hypothetical protein
VQTVLQVLEQELSLGHGKASAGAAQALRQALKEHGRWIDEKLQHHADQVLLAAGELEGWQRWRADQLRTELVQKAEALFKPVPPTPEGTEPAPPQPVMGGRKMQEALRQLREQWKQTDQGGLPNHGLWKRFDRACNQAHKMVEQWLEKVRADAAAHKAQRQALTEELQAWAQAHAQGPDWKAVARQLQQFENRWRDAGHMSEKAFVEVQNAWREAMKAARAPIDAVQQASVVRRQALIAEAEQLAASDVLRVEAVKALQQRWQAEAQTMVLERRLEQKLWDAFRQPIDNAFQRLWPQARTTNLLEDSLAPDLAADGQLTERMIERFLALSRYVHARSVSLESGQVLHAFCAALRSCLQEHMVGVAQLANHQGAREQSHAGRDARARREPLTSPPPPLLPSSQCGV